MSEIFSLCVQCGFNVPVDEDGCCIQCGADSLGPYADEAGRLRSDLEAARREIAILNRMVEAIAARVKHLRPNSLEWMCGAEIIAHYRAEAEKAADKTDKGVTD